MSGWFFNITWYDIMGCIVMSYLLIFCHFLFVNVPAWNRLICIEMRGLLWCVSICLHECWKEQLEVPLAACQSWKFGSRMPGLLVGAWRLQGWVLICRLTLGVFTVFTCLGKASLFTYIQLYIYIYVLKWNIRNIITNLIPLSFFLLPLPPFATFPL